MSEPAQNTTRARRVWPLAATAALIAIVLVAVALSDLRREPAVPVNASAPVASAPLASAPLASAPTTAQPALPEDARVPERARGKMMRNAEARVNPQQPTPLMTAWSDAFAGKHTASTSPTDNGASENVPRVAPRLRQMAERVNLTPEQLDTLALALNDERAQIAALRQQRHNGTLTHEQVRAQIDALRDRTDARVGLVLDAAQRAAFIELRDHGRHEDNR